MIDYATPVFTMQENIALGPKTTMRIGGRAKYYAELSTKQDVEEACTFANVKQLPLVVLGGGSNTIFDDGTIEALVVRVKAERALFEPRTSREGAGSRSDEPLDSPHGGSLEESSRNVIVEAGKNLASLINELAEANLDLSPLTGILGTLGGAVFGNAGQGHGGIWIEHYIRSVEAFVDGHWKAFERAALEFRYRWSSFKEMTAPVIWSVTLQVPSKPKSEVQAEVQRLLQKRIETQPHVKTAGSCFLSLPDGTPAWQVIDAAGLRGRKVGGVKISEKHANFLIADQGAKFSDAQALIEHVRHTVPHPLTVEMRLMGKDGKAMM